MPLPRTISGSTQLDGGADLHEVLFTRAMVAKAPLEVKLAIHDPHNCIYVTHTHHPEAGSKENRARCVGFLIKRWGREELIRWISSIGQMLKGHEADYLINYVQECPEWTRPLRNHERTGTAAERRS